MKPWMEDFICLCLSKIPDLPYRRRLAGELADHLASLSADLEAGGLTAGQAQALALERMGDPEALSAAYLAQWRQRMNAPRHRLPRLLFLLSFVCYAALMFGLGVLYIANTSNFGKTYPGYWGIVSILLAFVLVAVPMFAGLPRSWDLIRYGCWLYAVMQVLPVLCWMTLGGPFEISGLMVSDFAGVLLHFVLAGWSAVNGYQLDCYKKAFAG
ncbi:MAG: hypothetical protein Q3X94_03200 [Oscillospiraceae bacterium]|nr:hypothetical protein [Oscillospiraceae bacterium]